MPTGFSHIAVIGPGLLGGSVALAVRRADPTCQVSLWARRPEVLEGLRVMELADRVTTDLGEAVDGADLVVLATPVGIMPDVVGRLVNGLLTEGTVITDVGSVKGPVVREIDAILAHRSGVSFIGSHPMAGSERSGVSHAREGLFDGAMCVLTPGASTTSAALARVRDFWEKMGARVCELEPGAHDRAVAAISHLPHLVASALAKTSLEPDASVASLAANGFRDTTRVAGGNPDMWAEIALLNREALREPLVRMGESLREMLAFLDNMEHEKLRRFLGEAKELRDAAFPYKETPPSIEG